MALIMYHQRVDTVFPTVHRLMVHTGSPCACDDVWSMSFFIPVLISIMEALTYSQLSLWGLPWFHGIWCNEKIKLHNSDFVSARHEFIWAFSVTWPWYISPSPKKKKLSRLEKGLRTVVLIVTWELSLLCTTMHLSTSPVYNPCWISLGSGWRLCTQAGKTTFLDVSPKDSLWSSLHSGYRKKAHAHKCFLINDQKALVWQGE